MKKTLIKTLAIVAVSGLLVAPATASDHKSDHKMTEKMTEKMKKMSGEKGNQFNWARQAGDIIESNVVTPDGKELGSVEDLVIGKDGQIQYVILERGGFIGIGDEEYAIPWRSIQVGKNLDTLVADVDQETIQKFTDKKKQSESEGGKYAKSSKSSDEKKSEQAKSDKSGKSKEQESQKRLSEMKPQKIKDWFGKEVVSKDKKTLGTLENAFIDENGKITYMIVKPEKGEELRPIPTRMMQRTEKKKLMAEIDQKTFEGAPSFKKSDRPELGKQKWEEKVRGYYKEEKSQKDKKSP